MMTNIKILYCLFLLGLSLFFSIVSLIKRRKFDANSSSNSYSIVRIFDLEIVTVILIIVGITICVRELI
jgi:uncharacterized membrane protein